MDKLMAKLARLDRPERTIQRGLQNYARDRQKRAEEYPPETAANRPAAGRSSWNVRGARTQTAKRNRGYSEKMSNKWNNWPVTILGRTVRLEIVNTASYAPYVIGERQARFHSMRGWLRTDKLIKTTLNLAVREIEIEIGRELNR